MNDNVITWEKILHDFQSIPKSEINRTFMQISGYPHYENVCSNILAFFLDPKNEHGLKDLCYQALLSCIREKSPQLIASEVQEAKVIKVGREVDCNGKRLDLLLESDQFVIGIENKIWHHLFNELEVYGEKIQTRAKEKNLPYICIILGIRKETPSHGFISITYSEFFNYLKSLMGYYTVKASAKFVIYLNDFIKTIENLQGSEMLNNQQVKFFKDNYQSITSLIQQFESHQKTLNGEVSALAGELRSVFEAEDSLVKVWIYQQSTLVLDFTLPNRLAIDATLSPEGWKIELFPRVAKDVALCDRIIPSLGTGPFPKSGNRSLVFRETVDCNRAQMKQRIEDIARAILKFQQPSYQVISE
jgi:hypothetical protein